MDFRYESPFLMDSLVVGETPAAHRAAIAAPVVSGSASDLRAVSLPSAFW